MEKPLDGAHGAAPHAAAHEAAAGLQQLRHAIRLLSPDIAAGFSSGHSSPAWAPLRQLSAAGVPLRDLVDALHASAPLRLAVQEGNVQRAASVISGWLVEHVLELRGSGIPAARLQQLSQAGFGVGEISLAMQVMPGLRGELMRGDFQHPAQIAQVMHETLLATGRTVHQNPALLAAGRQFPARPADAEAWSENYLRLARRLQSVGIRTPDADEVRLSTDHPNAEDEALLPVGLPTPPAPPANLQLATWTAVALAVAILLLLFLEHCV
ncbi:MAG: hypothetical protein P4M01_00210 [Acidobacteriota bacterium]|nr:hypothetical protein [Acidobacteriota bacterium]